MFALSPDAAQPCPADPRHAQIARARSLAFGEQALAGMPPATLPATPAGIAPWLWRSWQRCLAAGRCARHVTATRRCCRRRTP